MSKRAGRISAALTVTLSLLCLALPATPADTPDDKWGVDILMYGMAAGIEGRVGAGNAPGVDVNLSFSDIVSQMEFGVTGAARVYKGRWSINGDLMYTGLGMENDVIKVDANSWIISGDVGYQATRDLQFLGGLRGSALRSTIEYKGPLHLTTKPKKSWVDPVIGLRYTPWLSPKWFLWSQFDIGGFGVGSDFAWQANAVVGRKFSERWSMAFGYRFLGFDYEKGEGLDHLLYDVTMSGPVGGLALSF